MKKLWRYLFRVLIYIFALGSSHTVLMAQEDSVNNKEQQLPDSLAIVKMDSLSEVTITAKKQLYEIEKGKIVMNVQNSALTSGSSALELIRKLPGVSLGQDDEVVLMGTTGINVMIDGKMSYLSGKQLTMLLKGINGENIVKLELLTTPSAEFDAQGNAGIINIATKRKINKGYAIDLRSTMSKGRFWMVNENITASVNAGKISVYGSVDYNTPHSVMNGNSSSTIFENGNPLLLERTKESIYKVQFYTYKIGADWQVAPRHEFSAYYHGYFDDFTSNNYSDQYKYLPNQSLDNITRSFNALVEPYHYDAANASYTFAIDSLGKKIITDAHYISYRNLSDGLMESDNYDGNDQFTGVRNVLRSHQPGFIKIKSLKTDMILPFTAVTIKSGLKYAVVTNDNNYQFDSLINSGFVKAESISNHFKYTERIAAGYISFSKKIGHTAIDAGLRLEHTDADGLTVKQDFSNRWKYTRLFPSLSIDHYLDDDHKLNFSISRRIDRPAYANLNPVRWYVDQYFYYSGNPSLVPEMAWLFSAAYTFKQKYILTSSYRQSNNFLTRQLVPDSSGAIKSQMTNFREMKRFDLLLTVPVTLAPYWNMQWVAGINYTTYPIAQKAGFSTLSLWGGNIQLSQQIKLPAKTQFELSSSFYSDELYGIYRRGNYLLIDAGFKKSFLRDKLDIHLTISDFLRTNRYIGISQSDISDYRYHDMKDSRRMGLSLRYHIGGKLISKKGNRIEEQDRL